MGPYVCMFVVWILSVLACACSMAASLAYRSPPPATINRLGLCLKNNTQGWPLTFSDPHPILPPLHCVHLYVEKCEIWNNTLFCSIRSYKTARTLLVKILLFIYAVVVLHGNEPCGERDKKLNTMDHYLQTGWFALESKVSFSKDSIE